MRGWVVRSAVGVLCLAAGVASAETWIPAARAGAAIDGVWRSRGYGHVLAIRDGRRTLYHVAGGFCYRDPAGSGGDDDSYRLVAVASPARIAFAAAPSETRYTFDRIAALPPACRHDRRWSAQAMGRLIAATFADLYPGFGRRGRTRAGLAVALATADRGPPGLVYFRRAARALDGLDDAHVGLAAAIDGTEHEVESGEATTLRRVRADAALGPDAATRERRWSAAYRDGIVGLLDGGGHHVANRRILWGTIGRIGYINVATMGAFDKDAAPDDVVALDAALDAAIAAFRGLPGVIVDVTNNRGGYDALALRIAGRFADRRRLAFAKRAVGARGGWQRFYVEPSDRPRYVGKVALLTSDITVSAGETFTLAMRALPTVTQIGARTRGALSDQLTKPLPNGWTLTLPAEHYRDARGRSPEGVGIGPMRALPLTADHARMVATVATGLAAPVPQGRAGAPLRGAAQSDPRTTPR